MSGMVSAHCDSYVSDTVTVSNSMSVGGTFDLLSNTAYYPSTTVTWNGCIAMEGRMHVYEVIAVNRRTFVVQNVPVVVASNRDNALLKAVATMSNGNIQIDFEEWHIEVRKLFSFEPIGGDE